MPTEFDPRDTNKDGKVGPLEAAAAKGNIFAKGLNKAVDFATVDDPDSQQVKNAAAAIGGAGDSGGTVNTRSQMLEGTEAGKNLIQAQANELANKDPSKTEELAEATKQASAEAEAEGDKKDEGATNTDVSDVTAPGVVEEAKQDPQSRYKLKSIFQAYADGDIDKSTRNYLIVDTLGTFARNMGKDLGNVAAAFSGGTVNNDRETSQWDKRNEAIMQSGIESEQADIAGSREKRMADQQNANLIASKLQNMSMQDRRNLAAKVQAMAKDVPGDTAKVAMYTKAAQMLQNPSMTTTDLAMLGGSELLGEIVKKLKGE